MSDDRAQQCRPKLYGIAYRMLSSASDAEDILQDAYLRWHQTDDGRVQIPEAWLSRYPGLRSARPASQSRRGAAIDPAPEVVDQERCIP